MNFSDEFLEALGAWQNGWKEDKARRLIVTEGLKKAVKKQQLPDNVINAETTCYRKRFLVPSNPQNGGDFGPLFFDGGLEEGVASWTTVRKYAEAFKSPMRDGTIAAVFEHVPRDGEVILNIEELWRCEGFTDAVDSFVKKGGCYAEAIVNFGPHQKEVIMDSLLVLEEIVGLSGKSSSFELLCEIAEIKTEEEREKAWKHLIDNNLVPEEPRWMSKEVSQKALANAKQAFIEKHGKNNLKNISF